MKNFHDSELAQVTAEMTKLTLIDKETQDEILRDWGIDWREPE